MIIVDGHEDLAYNALMDGRNYLLSAHTIRADEEGGPVPDVNGVCMLGLPEWLQGGVAVVVTTLIAIPRTHANPGEAGYPNAEAAFQQAIAQFNVYRTWADHPQIRLVAQRSDLDAVLVLLIENADLIRAVDEVDFWYEQGVRLIGPAWHTNRYTGSSMDAIDIVCEIAGDALHAGIGTDFDGGFGAEATPVELDTVADLPRVAEALTRRGCNQQAVEQIMGGNWLRVLRRHLSAE